MSLSESGVTPPPSPPSSDSSDDDDGEELGEEQGTRVVPGEPVERRDWNAPPPALAFGADVVDLTDEDRLAIGVQESLNLQETVKKEDTGPDGVSQAEQLMIDEAIRRSKLPADTPQSTKLIAKQIPRLFKTNCIKL